MDQLNVIAPDGTQLACWELAGDGTQSGAPLVLVHGIGLHGRCWSPVARLVGPALRPLGLDLRGHGTSAQSPDGGYEWDRLATDIVALIDTLDLADGPAGVVGAGHSAGATALLLAEAQRPGTFSRLWLWEPIVTVPGSDLRSRRSPEFAARARRRRWQFSSVEDARHHLEGRGMFADFSPEAFEAFLSGGLVADEGAGVRLACAPEDEARAYEAAATQQAWELLTAGGAPTRLVGGACSPAMPGNDMAAVAQRLAAPAPVVMSGLGHFGPFQAPSRIAADISAWVH